MKRSKTVSLALMGLSPFILTSCSEPEQEVLIYPSVQSCIDDGKLDAQKCQEEYDRAVKEHERTAPHYTSENECANDFGATQCYQPFGGNYFMPLLAGYMIGRVTAPNNNYYGGGGGYSSWGGYSSPVYRTRYDPYSWRTSDGYSIGNGQGRVSVPQSATKPKVSASTLSRGGFGSQSAARSSWGS